MLCQHCNQNEATTHIKKSINGHKEEMHLCSECAAKLGVMEDFKIPSMSEIFDDGLLGGFLKASTAARNSLAGIDRCATCGSSFNDIVSSGHVGCSDCYEKFADKLEPSIQKIHGKTKHIGKFISYTQESEPDSKPVKKEAKEEENVNPIEILKKELEEAIKEQRFEDAAVLRDKINAMEDTNE